MVGLAFSRLADHSAGLFNPPNVLNPQNIGYLIPNEEIDLFLEDVTDGRYDGKAFLYCYLQTLENPTLRKKLKLDSKIEGCMVRRPEAPLKKYDILTHIGPYALDNRAQVQVRENLRLSYHYAATKAMHKHKVPVTVIREGKPLKLEVPAFGKNDFLIKELQGTYPSYFVYGPLVFTPADMTAHYDYYDYYSSESPLSRRRSDKPRFPGEELVVVTSPLLQHKTARGYANPVNKVVKSVDDIAIKNFRHLIEVLRDGRDEFVTVEFFSKSADMIVLPRREMEKVTREVMDDNGITRRGTESIMAVWHKKDAK
jgi:hypothetical protein